MTTILIKQEAVKMENSMKKSGFCANCRQQLIPIHDLSNPEEEDSEPKGVYEINLDIEEIVEEMNDGHLSFQSRQGSKSVKVKEVLSAIYKLVYLDIFTNSTYVIQDNFLGSDEDVGVCHRCASVLTNLYKFYEEFNQMRQIDTYLSKRVELLDAIMESQVHLRSQDLGHEDFNCVPPDVVTEVIVEVDGEEFRMGAAGQHFQDNVETQRCDFDAAPCPPGPSFSRRTQNSQIVRVVNAPQPIIPIVDNFDSTEIIPNEDSIPNVDSYSNEDPMESIDDPEGTSPVQCGPGPWIKLHRLTVKDVEKARVTPSGRPARTKKLSRHLDSASFVHFGDSSPIKEEGSDSDYEFEGNENSGEEEIENEVDDEPYLTRKRRPTPRTQKSKYRTSGRTKRRRLRVVEALGGTLPCTECDKTFRRKFDLKKHLKTTHPEIQLYRCPQCEKSFLSEADLENHSFLHSGQKPLSCPICNKSYLIKKHYKRHMATHNPGESFKCPTCDEIFTERFQLKIHLKRHNKDTLFPCTVCQKAFQSLIHLKNHHKLRHSESTEMPFKCSVENCEKEFRGRQGLKNHMMEAHTDTPHLCPNCGLPFAQDSDLSVHMTICKDTKAVSCPQCEESFSSIHYLKTHMIIHGEKSFTCNVCDRVFYSAQKLKIHSYIHSGERPYICTVCQKGFISSNNLKMHFQVHTGEKRQLCAHCGAGFAQKPALDRHIMLVHSEDRPHICNVCNKAFKILQLLQRHKKTHNEKSNLCPHCGKSFALGQTLKRHLQTHTGEKPYKCQICGMSFPDNRPLKKHMMSHGLSDPLTITTGLDQSSTTRATVWCAENIVLTENVVLTENIEIDF